MGFNLAVILRESAQSSPDRPVAVYDGGRLTYRELDRASDRLAAALTAAGMKPGTPSRCNCRTSRSSSSPTSESLRRVPS